MSPADRDSKRIVDDVLALCPSSSLDATEDQHARLLAARDELEAQLLALRGGGRPIDRAARHHRARSLTSRSKRIEQAYARLETYMKPYIDKHRGGEG